ncbi:DedA family protein [Amnibacterium kyonggiense]|uniref:Membrane protein DedA with SNARE-associated domain n=1 Tax=Amnibacterium kyonggiense TaxID=595671 RepID=A0A4R7FPK5_9MICO|nr:DedA family protein [Amnibacterium kyonggiense]TDS79682.1 membrane protein DedA with SNARE-associated domain [Amnibacterium kyonggiense]
MTALAAEPQEGGLVAFAGDLLLALGDAGVGALVLLETVVPPVPSEVILPYAGYLARQGRLTIAGLIAWSTAGSTVGALLLYWLGAALGLRRSTRLLARTRLVDEDDLDRGAAWFHRHGAVAVLVGRLVPGVRSLISIPAGADRMHLGLFVLCTAIGSGAWNAALIGLGAALGTQRHVIDPYLDVLDVVVYAALAIALVVLVVRRLHRRRARNAD